jgi:hypothetical protein
LDNSAMLLSAFHDAARSTISIDEEFAPMLIAKFERGGAIPVVMTGVPAGYLMEAAQQAYQAVLAQLEDEDLGSLQFVVLHAEAWTKQFKKKEDSQHVGSLEKAFKEGDMDIRETLISILIEPKETSSIMQILRRTHEGVEWDKEKVLGPGESDPRWSFSLFERDQS